MGSLSGFVRLLRPVNAVMVGAAVVVGVFVSARSLTSVPPLPILLAFATGFTLTGSAMSINDYFDREIDSVNEPGRPIPSGEVKPHEAVVCSAVLSVLGLASAALNGLQVFAIGLIAWVMMMAYSAWGKRTGLPGNLMVSADIALPFLYGGVLAGDASTSLLFGALAFLSNTGREVAKGIVDVEGDRGRGVRTLAVSLGAPRAALLASVFYVSAVTVSVAPVLLGVVSFYYFPFVVVTDAGLVLGSVQLLRDPSRDTSRTVKNRTLIWMLFGLLAFAAGRLF